MTDREAILQALFARLQTIAMPQFCATKLCRRRIPDGGLIILRDGDPGEPETLLSPAFLLLAAPRACGSRCAKRRSGRARSRARRSVSARFPSPSRATAPWAAFATVSRRKRRTATCWRSRDRRRSKAQLFPSNLSTSPPIPSADFQLKQRR
jgi:hypothetical protein